jgi:hypothetical protein
MVAEGHQVANHTYDHPYLAKCTAAKVRSEIVSSANAITAVTGLTGTGNTGFYLRPPYGSWNSSVVAQAGVPVIWCTVDSGDWKYQNADRLVSYTSSAVQDGGIVVMHETIKSTAQGLDRLLTKLEQEGFTMVTVEDLFWRRGITPVAGQVYYSAKNTGVNRCEQALWYDETKLSSHWAAESIQYVKNAGLMTGNEYGEFTPNYPLTRGMFVTMLGRLEGVQAEEVPSGFSDIAENHYAAPYAAWAKENGILEGIGGSVFGVNNPLTRQELAVILARYAAWKGVQADSSSLSAYNDQSAIADWAKDGVATAYALGLLKGSNGAFSPLSTTTRAMGAVVLQRLAQYSWPDQGEEDSPVQDDLVSEEA